MVKISWESSKNKKKSLKFAFAKYMVLSIIAAVGLILIAIYWVGENASYDSAIPFLVIFIPSWIVICIALASKKFYENKLKRPLTILDAAAENIANNNLDFIVAYPVNDEFGRLCDSFEKMRASLSENNREMWRQMEERRRLNAAFSHDLRTPLTVLKGEAELLEKYVPYGKMDAEKVISTARTMESHIARLEGYVTTMNSLQRFEDIELTRVPVPVPEIVGRISYCAGMLSGDKQIIVDTSGLTAQSLNLDINIVMQVFENLAANALRYAKEEVTVCLAGVGVLIMSVKDDGDGFAPEDLAKVMEPFYKAKEDNKAQHFGMGLSICKILCEKHGGSLTAENIGGARVTAVFFGK